jgi:hypothetical protein
MKDRVHKMRETRLLFTAERKYQKLADYGLVREKYLDCVRVSCKVHNNPRVYYTSL